MFDLTKKIITHIDDELNLVLNPADGKSADPRYFQRYFVDFWNSDNGCNETITFFVSNKLFALLSDLNLWRSFLEKLAHPGFVPLHYYGDQFEPGEDFMYLTLQFNCEIK